jgi:UDP-N-acetylmuramoylalanine--D-glutamate ligase
MKTALVVGVGRSGSAAAAMLVRRGWHVVAVDTGPVDAPELSALGVDVRGEHLDPVPDVALVVKSPGVPGDAAQVVAARAAGASVISEIELASRELSNPIIAVTGTNGKTTTTELAAHLLRAAGRSALACGNQGLPLTSLVDSIDPSTWLVAECSSFQLEDIDRFHPRAAVVLNLTPDHLDRHRSMGDYRAAKLRIFQAMTADDLAIAPEGWAIPGRARPRVLRDGARRGPDDIAWSQGGLHVDGIGMVVGWNAIPLRGRHNRENVMAAAALVAHAARLTGPEIAAGLASFAGVAHRLEVVATYNGVTFVNDSKATNTDAASAALDAYPHGVHLIAGGKPKGASFAPLATAAQAVGVRCVYLIGEAGPEIGAAMRAVGVPTRDAGTLADAVAAASAAAAPGEVVLLAPGCASFDQFTSFEERGDRFRALVAELAPRRAPLGPNGGAVA